MDMTAQRPTILVLGDAMLDVWHHGQVSGQSPEAPVPVVKPRRVAEAPGGAANVAAICARIGARVIFPLVVGDDRTGERLRAETVARVPGLCSFHFDKPNRTTVKRRFVDESGAHLLRVDIDNEHSYEGSVGEDLAHYVLNALPAADAVICSDYRKGFFTPGWAQQIIEHAARCGIPVFVDSKRPHDPMWRGAFCFKHNWIEQGAVKPEDLRRQQDAQAVVVTHGGFGLMLYDSQGECGVGGSEIDNADVCGAGDAVVAALACAYARGTPLADAARTACAYAGQYVGTPTANRPPPPAGRFWSPEHVLGVPRSSINRLGFTNGCFDLLHEGHVRLLQEAASQTTHLVVALNSDLSIRSLKGVERPVGTYEVRRRKVLEVVPHATVVDFYNDPISLIELLTPDVIFKGADYADKPVRGAGTAPVVLVDLVPGVSTTQKIAEGVF